VQVVGESMNRKIPNGSWCLFKTDPGGMRQGKTVLVQARDIQDPETGGSFTIKNYRSTKVEFDDGSWGHENIVLEPYSNVPGFSDIELSGDELEGFTVVGEFVAIL